MAAVFSQFISVVLSLGYAFWKNPYFHISNLKPDRDLMTQIIKLGVPLSLQYSMVVISCMVLQRVVNGFGAITVATFTGQNYGAKKYKRIQDGLKKTFWIMREIWWSVAFV